MCRAIIASATAITIATLSGAYAAPQIVEADNGAVYTITEVGHTRGGSAIASVTPPGGAAPVDIQFDCRGHMIIYSYEGKGFSGSTYVAPGSVAGRIQDIACLGATIHP